MYVGAERKETILGFYLAITWSLLGIAKVLPMPFVLACLHTFLFN